MKGLVKEEYLQDIADAIREKNGQETTYKPSEMADAIRGIEMVGGDISKFGIQNEVKGTGVVTCDYVNENEHNVEVKLSSDTVTDFSGVEVKVIGKNLWNKEYASNENNWVKASNYWYIPILVGKGNTVTLSYLNDLQLGYDFYASVGKNEVQSNSYFWIYHSTSNVGRRTETIVAENDYIYIHLNREVEKFMQYIGNDLQIELLPYETEHELYTEKTYYANANGTVSGVTNASPIMNIVCEGVDITAKYYQCLSVEYDKFWDNFQDFGNRKTYRQAFYDFGRGWNDETYNPKYPIIMAYANYGGANTFNGNKKIADTKVDIICPDNVVLTTTFNNTAFKTIRKLVVNKEVTYSGTFNLCPELENITFEGEIGSSISFQNSPLLSDASVQNIVDCLADLTGSDTQTITFHADVKAKLTDEQIATITSKNWTLA